MPGMDIIAELNGSLTLMKREHVDERKTAILYSAAKFKSPPLCQSTVKLKQHPCG